MKPSKEFTKLPRIRLSSKPTRRASISNVGKDYFRSDPQIGVASKWSDVADKLYISDDIALINLSRRVGEANNAHDRKGWIVGRMVNWMTGISSDFVPLSGAVIGTVMKYNGDDVPESLDFGADFEVRLDVAQEMLGKMNNKARIEGLLS